MLQVEAAAGAKFPRPMRAWFIAGTARERRDWRAERAGGRGEEVERKGTTLGFVLHPQAISRAVIFHIFPSQSSLWLLNRGSWSGDREGAGVNYP